MKKPRTLTPDEQDRHAKLMGDLARINTNYQFWLEHNRDASTKEKLERKGHVTELKRLIQTQIDKLAWDNAP